MENKKTYTPEEVNIILSGHLYDDIYDNSGLPKKFKYDDVSLKPQACDQEAFKSLKGILASCKRVFGNKDGTSNGTSLLIYSNNVGNGKTTWAIKIMKYFIQTVAAPTAQECLFISVPELLQQNRAARTNFSARAELEEMKRRIKDARLVTFDDIAYKMESADDEAFLYELVDSRYRNWKHCIFTSNANLTEMRTILGQRIADRVLDRTIRIELKGGSRRGITNA